MTLRPPSTVNVVAPHTARDLRIASRLAWWCVFGAFRKNGSATLRSMVSTTLQLNGRLIAYPDASQERRFVISTRVLQLVAGAPTSRMDQSWHK